LSSLKDSVFFRKKSKKMTSPYFVELFNAITTSLLSSDLDSPMWRTSKNHFSLFETLFFFRKKSKKMTQFQFISINISTPTHLLPLHLDYPMWRTSENKPYWPFQIRKVRNFEFLSRQKVLYFRVLSNGSFFFRTFFRSGG
jgi:hypothetical protein